jgi:hypothetical protein
MIRTFYLKIMSRVFYRSATGAQPRTIILELVYAVLYEFKLELIQIYFNIIDWRGNCVWHKGQRGMKPDLIGLLRAT